MTVLTAQQVLDLALAAGFTRAEADIMTVIAHYESGWNPNNVGDLSLSKYGSRGLWQIFTGAHRPSEFGLGNSGWNIPLVAELAVPATNAHAARVVYKEQGYTAWSTYNSYHGTDGWASLLAQVTKVGTTGVTSKPPVVAKVATSRAYLSAKGNLNPHAAKAVEFEKAQASSGSKAWKDLCASLVRNSYGIPATAWGTHTRTAAEAWALVAEKDRHSWYTAPVGCPVYWTGGSSGAGHVAVADGKGNVWSNDFGPNGYIGDGKVRLIAQTAVSAHDPALKLQGWGETFLAVRVYQ